MNCVIKCGKKKILAMPSVGEQSVSARVVRKLEIATKSDIDQCRVSLKSLSDNNVTKITPQVKRVTGSSDFTSREIWLTVSEHVLEVSQN